MGTAGCERAVKAHPPVGKRSHTRCGPPTALTYASTPLWTTRGERRQARKLPPGGTRAGPPPSRTPQRLTTPKDACPAGSTKATNSMHTHSKAAPSSRARGMPPEHLAWAHIPHRAGQGLRARGAAVECGGAPPVADEESATGGARLAHHAEPPLTGQREPSRGRSSGRAPPRPTTPQGLHNGSRSAVATLLSLPGQPLGVKSAWLANTQLLTAPSSYREAKPPPQAGASSSDSSARAPRPCEVAAALSSPARRSWRGNTGCSRCQAAASSP